jgi:hypothetical protein
MVGNERQTVANPGASRAISSLTPARSTFGSPATGKFITIPRVSFKTTVTSRRPDRDAGSLVDLNFGFGLGGALYWATLRFSAVKSTMKERPAPWQTTNGKSSAPIDGELWIES